MIEIIFPVNSHTLITPDDGNVQRVLIHQNLEVGNHFEFYVRACESAVVLLSTTPLNGGSITPYGLTVTIGAEKNTKINIARYPDGDVLQSVEVNEPLYCHAER